MTKPKAQTLQQRFGFQDNELSTPRHDELMLWLDAWVDSNLPSLLIKEHTVVHVEEKVGYRHYDSKPMHIEEFDLRYGLNEETYPRVTVSVNKKIWECPITDKSYTIGFADMLCRAEGQWGELQYSVESGKLSLTHYRDARLFFEVKPTIASLGEVIRQVRMYETYTSPLLTFGRGDYARWFIVSPDTRFKTQIESQDIGFVEVK